MAITNLSTGNLLTFTDDAGVIFNFADPGTGAGTGQFATFLMIGSNSGTEEGFNTDGSPLPMDDKQQEHTNAVLLSTIPIVTVGTETSSHGSDESAPYFAASNARSR